MEAREIIPATPGHHHGARPMYSLFCAFCEKFHSPSLPFANATLIHQRFSAPSIMFHMQSFSIQARHVLNLL